MKILIHLAIVVWALTFGVTRAQTPPNTSIPETPGIGNNKVGENASKAEDRTDGSLPQVPDFAKQGARGSGPDLTSVSLFDRPQGPATVISQRNFAIPFALTPSENAGSFFVELLVSADQGKSWSPSGKIDYPGTKKEFFFRAPRDGEYWFVLRTVFPGGKMKTSPVQAILVRAETPKAEIPTKTTGAAQTTGATKTTSPASTPSLASTPNTAKSPGLANAPQHTLTIPKKSAGGPVTASGLSMPSAAPSTAAKVAAPSLAGPASDSDKSVSKPAGSEVPKPARDVPELQMPTRPTLVKQDAETSSKKTPEIGTPSPVETTVAKPAIKPADTKNADAKSAIAPPEDVAFPGQIKSISLGRTQEGFPTVMVRWFRPVDVGFPAEMGGSLRIERSENANGPWTTVVSDLQKSQAGYWWKATQLDNMPFYLRIVTTDKQGRETSDVVQRPIDLRGKLDILPGTESAGAPSGLPQNARQNAGQNVGQNLQQDAPQSVPQNVQQDTAAPVRSEPKGEAIASHVSKTGAKSTEDGFLSRLFNGRNKNKQMTPPPTPQESLANDKRNTNNQPFRNADGSVSGVPAANYQSVSNSATADEPSPTFNMSGNAPDASNQSGGNATVETAGQNPQNGWNDPSIQTNGGSPSNYTGSSPPGVQTASNQRTPQRNYDPGELNWNPLFTEGFGAIFHPRPQESRVGMQSFGNGQVETPPAPQKRSIFTRPVPQSAIPRQEETGYNDPSGDYSVPNANANAWQQGMSAPVQQANMPNGANASEIIYLDQHGNRIGNPFASGGMGMPSQGGMPQGNQSSLPMEGGQYIIGPSGDLIPYNASASDGMATSYPGATSPNSPQGSGIYMPGPRNSGSTGFSRSDVVQGAMPAGTMSDAGVIPDSAGSR